MMRKDAIQNERSWATGRECMAIAATVAVLVLFSGLGGCSRSQNKGTASTAEQTLVGEEGALQPGAKPVTISVIGDTARVVPPRFGMSKNLRERCQWHNTSGDTLLLIFDDQPVGQLIPPRNWSPVFHVCTGCNTGAYTYRLSAIRNGVPVPLVYTGPPDPPQVDIGS